MRMRKNFTLLFLMGIFGLFSTNLFAQEPQDATIAPENIKYWIGEGENQAIFIVNWATPDTALAWGYRFSEESVTIKDIMDGIAAVDTRFGYIASGSFISDITFNDGVLDLRLNTPGWVAYLVNGNSSWNTYDVQPVINGQYVKWGDTDCGTMIDPENWIYVWEKPVAPVYPLADEAMIEPSEIIYWIGEGQNQAIFAVNFADPQDVCYAWGYRFATESVTIKEMMAAIAEVDERFAFTDAVSPYGGYMLTDLTFNLGEDHFVLQGYNAMYNLNGMVSWYSFDAQAVVNGDFVKWGDYNIGTEIAAWTYVWETPVTPVPAYDAVNENAFGLAIYPNPATTYTMLEVGEMNNATVTVSDLQGRVVRSFAVNHANATIRIEMDGVKAGLYFVTVSDGTNRQTVKLSVK